MLDTHKWLKDNFKFTKEGIVCYKAFGNTTYDQAVFGRIRRNKILKEVCNPNRQDSCGCGINVGTMDYINTTYRNCDIKIYKCLIPWEYTCTIVVPYSTNGKFRCEYLKLLEKIS